mgnify:CR=1
MYRVMYYENWVMEYCSVGNYGTFEQAEARKREWVDILYKNGVKAHSVYIDWCLSI